MLYEIILGFVGLLTFLYFYLTRNYGYFKSRGVTEAPGYFPFGSYNNFKMMTGKRGFLTVLDDIYYDYPNEKMVGIFSFDKPVLVINDLDLTKQILIKDFDYFTDRRTFELDKSSKAHKVFSQMLTMLKGDQWKSMRSTMSPVFTSGKLKVMTGIINCVGKDFVKYLGDKADKGEELRGKEVMTSYTLEAIANAGLGVQANAFSEPEGKFITMVNEATGGGGKKDFKRMMKFMLMMALPKVAKFFKISFISDNVVEFFTDVIRQTVDQRKKEKVRRNDLIDLILDTIKDSSSEVEEKESQFEKDATMKSENSLRKSVTEEEYESFLLSNVFVLFFAGFDTSSSALSTCLYAMANNQDIQEKLYQEISSAIEDKDGKDLDYNEINALPYLDMVVHETLRFFTAMLERVCVKDYKVPGTDFVVPKGMLVQIPSGAIIKDAKHFPNPMVFNPENFSPEAKSQRNPYAFLTFGQGPRNCIGMRMALLMMKIGIIHTLTHFKVVRGEKCGTTMELDPKSMTGEPMGGVWVKFERRES